MTDPELNYLAHLADDSERFAEVLTGLDPTTRVPTCPDWTAADLVWHLGEVQWFWSRVIRHRPVHPRDITEPDPARPGSYEALLLFAEQSAMDLVGALDAAAPSESAWTWSREQTVGFTYRRQAQEALIHRLDAELTAGKRSPMDAALCSDGVDEAIRIMFGGSPTDGEISADPAATVRFTASDTGRQWFVTLGRVRGERDGKPYEKAAFIPAEEDPGEQAAADITASAEDLDCWLWGRPSRHRVDHHGDHDVLARVAAIVHEGID
jgi:uncharacterized protein (TIGR03083 family)